MAERTFAARLLAWFDLHGRHDLPWQADPSPYSVWVSEIMLQQTQVATVVRYYERFMQRFPSVEALAAADADAVLTVWSGLGYYARARNLKRAAEIVVERFGGRVPTTLAELVTLPGIGRSTAGAILALTTGQRLPILDGNVKRVLARYHAVAGWPGEPAVERALWELADRNTPAQRLAAYTQAIMDLGATLCTRARPACTVCPLAEDCRACALGTQAAFPAPRPKRERPRRSTTMLVVLDPAGRVLLERRPARGVWGGLLQLPGARARGDDRCSGARAVSAPRRRKSASSAVIEHALHALRSRHLTADRDDSSARRVRSWMATAIVWYNPGTEIGVGVPAPVAALLKSLGEVSRARSASPMDDRHEAPIARAVS